MLYFLFNNWKTLTEFKYKKLENIPKNIPTSDLLYFWILLYFELSTVN